VPYLIRSLSSLRLELPRLPPVDPAVAILAGDSQAGYRCDEAAATDRKQTVPDISAWVCPASRQVELLAGQCC